MVARCVALHPEPQTLNLKPKTPNDEKAAGRQLHISETILKSKPLTLNKSEQKTMNSDPQPPNLYQTPTTGPETDRLQPVRRRANRDHPNRQLSRHLRVIP